MKKIAFNIIAILAILMPTTVLADVEPYAVLSKDSTKLTFYFDNQKKSRNGLNVGPYKYDSQKQGSQLSYTLVKTDWDAAKDKISNVVFDSSFENCNTITSTAFWFFNCKNLTTITGISNLKTEEVTDMGFMFHGCSSLTNLDLTSFNTQKVTSMLCMFHGCSGLTNLDLSSFKTENVSDMGHMFSDCSSLTRLDLSKFNTEKVTCMFYMFDGCSNLSNLNIKGFKTDNVTNFCYMFSRCSKLEKLDVGGFNSINVEYFIGMFSDCKSLVSLDLSSFNTLNAIDISSMFYQCTGLKRLDISGFNTTNVSNMHRMFQTCGNLMKIIAGNEWSTTKVTNGENMFKGCYSLLGGKGTKYDDNYVDQTFAHIDEGSSNPGYFTRANNYVPYVVLNEDSTKLIFYFDDQKLVRNGINIGPVNNYSYGENNVAKSVITNGWNSKIKKVRIVEFDTSFADCDTLSSTAGWFDGCNELTTIKGLSNLKTDYVTDMKFMFSGCSSLTNLDLSGFNTEYLTNMDYMFEGCSSLESLDLSRFRMDKMTSLSHVFMGCTCLTSLNLMKGRTDYITTMSGLFYGCSNLTSLDVTGFKTNNVTDMSFMFRDCSSLKSLDVSGFYTGNVKNMISMFDGCSGLTELDLSGFITDNVTNMNFMFSNCSGLKNLDISGFKTDNVTDMGGMFQLCSSLISLDVSSFKTSKVTNMGFMFSQCSSLSTLDLNSFYTGNVTSMSCMFQCVQELTCLDLSGFNTEKVKSMSGMFAYSFNLKTIYVGGEWSTTNVTEANEMFKGCYSLLGGMGTKYDDNYVDQTFAHIDEGISNPGYLTRPTTFRLYISALGNGSITYDNNRIRNQSVKYIVEADSSVSIAIIPDEGYCVKNLIVNNKDVTSNISDNCYTISSINTNISIEIEFAKTYTLSVKASGNGAVVFGETSVKSGSKTFSIIEGISTTITMTPDEGNKVKSVTINNEDVTSKILNNQYTIDSIKNDTYVEVEFEPITYTLTIKAIGYGTINFGESFVRCETSTFNVTEGSSVTVKIIPDEGRYVKSLNVNNEDVTSNITDNNYTIRNINSNIDIKATFEINSTIINSGINYSVVSEDEKTVVLAKGNYGPYISIPSSFTAYNVEWTITGIDQGTFDNASELAAVIWDPEIKFDGNINNPNLLFYVKSADYAPDNINNVIVNNEAKSITLTDAEGGNNFYCPREFTAEKITYEHNYSMKTGYNTCQGWESIVLPFDVAVVTNNVGTALVPYSLWTYGDSKRPFWLYGMNENGWNAESAIKANTPYIISMPNNENYDDDYNLSGNIIFSASNVKVKASNDLSYGHHNHLSLVPNYQNKESAPEIYALNVNNLWDKNTENDIAEGSAFVRNLRKIRPFEAYMTVEGGSATRSITIFGDDDVTGIANLPMINNRKNSKIKVYTLSGVLVKQGTDESVTEGLPKGVYIINNRKVVVD